MQRIDPLLRAVSNMMTRFGGPAELIVTGEPVYDPSTSTVTNTEVSYPVQAMMLDYIKKGDGATAMPNSLIQAGDKQIVIKADDDVPEPLPKVHSIVFKGIRYNLIAVKDYDTSGLTPFLYEAYGRA